MNTSKLSAAISQGLSGEKGGSESSRKAIESPDSLISIAQARIIDLISEGEIEGFYSGANFLRDVYLDETPVENPDGTRNFKSFNIDARSGTQNQEYIPGFPAVESELSGIGAELRADTPWTRSFSNLQLSAIRVRLGLGAFYKTNTENGDVTGTSVEYAIDVATDGGPFVEKSRSWFNGKASEYERSHRIDLPKATTSGWILRVRRLTPDTSSLYISDDTHVVSVTEIIDAKLRYPMSAVVGLQFDASQFQSIPTRAYRIKGRRIRVPVNYDPVTRTYSGPWNGTFKIAYSNNPAWVFYDLTTHKRYGLGKLVADLQIDKYALYGIAQYCDEMVSDGFGGTEPRMVCNLYLQQAADAWKVISDLASIFRGICYWSGGAIVPICDRPTDPVYTYTNGNVVEGIFAYQSSGRKARHTAVLVSYNDMSNFGRMKTDYYDDPEMIARFGLQVTEIMAMGATSRGQAQRMARWLLLSEKMLTNSCSWQVGMDGTFALPGQIVRVADKYRAGKRTGGRIKSATINSVTLDQAPSPIPVNGDTLTVNLPTGVSQTRTINSVTGGGSILGVSANFTVAPVPQSVWAVESNALKNQLYKILSVTMGEGGVFQLTALQHDQELFDAVDLGTPITADPISGIASPNQVRPASLTLTSVERAGEIIAMPLLTASWPVAPGAVKYQIQWRKDSGEWTSPQEVFGTTAEFQNPFPGVYEAKVQAINPLGVISVPKFSEPYTLTDPTTHPGFVAAMNAEIAEALGIAQDALDTIEALEDGGMMSYFQASAPTGLGPEDVGDIWFDSDDGNKIYRWSGSAWVATPDSGIAAAILAASNAQATADGKVKTFAQSSPVPSATGVGDLWIHTGNGNKLYRATAAGTANWVTLQDAGIAQAIAAAANAQATADGAIVSFWQNTAPVIGSGAGQAQVGDIWFDTDDGNKVWRVVGSAWVDAQDDALAAALAAASTAQATADGKVKTFFAPDASPPTATAVGDLWFKTTSLVLVRWNGTTWGDIIGDVTAGQIAGNGLNMLWDEYTQFRSATAPNVSTSEASVVTVADSTAIGGYALRSQSTSTNTGAFVALAPVWNTSSTPINGQRFIVSFYARASVSGHTVAFEIFDGSTGMNSPVNIAITNTTGWTRYWIAITTSSAIQQGNLIVRVNRPGVNGRQVFFDRIMIEPQVGNLSTPSPWVPGSAGLAARAAQVAAATAQAAADGVVDIYRQSAAPTFGPAKAGDYWQDSDDNKWYYSPSGSSWTEVTDPRIPQAISDAAAAQSTANSRIRTFYASSAPTPTAVGDLWYNTLTSVLARWDGSAWVNTADNSIAALNPNLINPGFEQGLTGWSDLSYGLTGWASASPAVTPSGTKVMTKSGGASGTSGILNAANMAVTPGSMVVTRLTVKADSNPAGGVEIGMAFYSSTGALISWSLSTPDFNKDYCNGVWKEFIKTVPVPGTAVFGKMFILVTGYTGTGTWSFDSARADNLEDASAGVNVLPNSEWIQNLTGWTGLSSIGSQNEAKYAQAAALADNVQGYIYTDLTSDLSIGVGKKMSAQCEVQVTGSTTSNTVAWLRLECFNVSNASLGYVDSAAFGMGTSYSPLTVDTWQRISVNGMNIPTGTTRVRFMVVIRGTGTWRFRKPKAERGDFATNYSPSSDIVWGSQLVISGSGMRIGDQRNLLQSLVNAYGAVSDAVPITATSAGAVSINAFTVKMGGSSVAYNAVSNAVTGLTVGTTYVIYCFDAAFAGGTRTWYASSGSYAALMSLGDDLVVAGTVKIPASGSAGGGSGGTDPDDDPLCVHYDSYLPDGRLVRDLKVGDMVTCVDVRTDMIEEHPVLKIGFSEAPCYRLASPELCTVIQSAETAMDLPGGGVAKTTEMLGKKMLICVNGEVAEDICMDVQYLGVLPVINIDLGDRMFFAGESPGATIATHNIRMK